MNNKITIKNDIFKIAGMEFIKMREENGAIIAVAKKRVFSSIFGENNNFSTSQIISRLESEILPKIIEAVGQENILDFETDLLSLDGTDDYGKINSKISIPTLDFFRANKKIFDKHGYDGWMWLSTPDSTNNSWTLCVSSSGDFNDDDCYDYCGVRPSLRFSSLIFVSREE